MPSVNTSPLDALNEQNINIRSSVTRLLIDSLKHATQDSLIEVLAYLDIDNVEAVQVELDYIAQELADSHPNPLPLDTFPAEEDAIRNRDLAREFRV